MAQVIKILKNNKVKNSSLFLVFVIFPVSALYAAWLTDSWIFSDMDEDEGPVTPEEKELMEHIEYNLKNVQCPAKEGKELLDYWECLWRTSITSEGMEQHRRILVENMAYRYDTGGSHHRNRVPKPLSRMKRESQKKRVRRQTSSESWNYKRMIAYFLDSFLLALPFYGHVQPYVNECHSAYLAPSSSIFDFWKCFRDLASIRVYGSPANPAVPFSLDPTFRTSTFPPINNDYDSREFKLLNLTDIFQNDSPYQFKLEFERLRNEDKKSDFRGADPYLDGAWSDFRYRYDNLNSKQQQPAWTYNGLYRPARWNELDNRKFYLPLRKSAKLDGVEFLSELVQTYPGTGDIAADSRSHLQAPLDPRWTKDSGYSAYTRFPLPLFTKNDLAYYKSKHLIDPSVKMKSDDAIIQDIIDGLIAFQKESSGFLAVFDYVTGTFKPNMSYTMEEDIPFAQAYREFMTHVFKIDIGKYRAEQSRLQNRTLLLEEYEIIRSLLRKYTEGVIVQQACVREMVDKYDFRRDGRELEELIEKAKNSDQNNPNGACILTSTYGESINHTKANVQQSWVSLLPLYQLYFDRKDARQRYSLPRYPLEYNVCSQTDQSPIDIDTKRSRQSSLKDYKFGDAAYRLVRFYMFFPIDSSTLLTVGVVGGERQDGSAVQLTGGAVKGHPLSFQYMHIRYANSWKAKGSEHTFDGKGSPMELQMVFTISGSADSIKYWHVLAWVQNQLFQFRGKLVIILSVLVDVLASDEAVKKKIAKDGLNQDPYLFEPFAQAAYHFRDKFENSTERPRGFISLDPSFRFIDFIPRKSSRFYTYRGSLSWPPCFGYVIWSVYEQRLYMSKRQFDQFTQIPAYGINDNNRASDNSRKQEDIWVDAEHDATLDYATIQSLKRQRTIDRHILVGYHDIAQTETELVGAEIYYTNEDSGSATHSGQLLLVILSFAVCFKFY